MELNEVRDRGAAVLDEVERAIVGKRDALELILIGVLADGHVLLEDYPGLAKTLIARSFARATSLRFSRIQFTPDLMPSDVTGSSIFDQRRGESSRVIPRRGARPRRAALARSRALPRRCPRPARVAPTAQAGASADVRARAPRPP